MEQTDPPAKVASNAELGRAALIARAVAIRKKIQQMFDDAEHWNRVHTPWKGKPIDPDPDGQLRRIADGIDRMLANETPNGKVEPATPAKE